MTSFLKSLAMAIVLTILILAWLAFREGLFSSPDALDEQAAALDGGVLDQWPFVDASLDDAGAPDAGQPDAGAPDAGQLDAGVPGAGQPDAGAPDAGQPDAGSAADAAPKTPSLGLDGMVRVSLNKLAIRDKQRRDVLRVKRVRASMKLRDMQRGIMRVPQGHIEGADITLYRDGTGKISLANAFRTSSAAVVLEELPDEPPDGGAWLIEAGPITLKDVRLTLGFTATPVQFRIDRGTMRVRRGQNDSGPVIYFDQIEGAMLQPQPLPRPVRIAFAKGVVRLKGRPMVEMVARTCLGISELRVRAVVPARKQPVELTGNSIGVSALLGRIVLEVVGAFKSDKINYDWGVVKIGGGRSCLQPPTARKEGATP